MLLLDPHARRASLSHCNPETKLIPPEMHSLILHTIIHCSEAAGWGDALSGGKTHGVDIGKLHEGAMFWIRRASDRTAFSRILRRGASHSIRANG